MPNLATLLAALATASAVIPATTALVRPKSRKKSDEEYEALLQQKRDALKDIANNPKPLPTPKPSPTPTTYNLDEVEQGEFDRLGMQGKSEEEQEEFKQYFRSLRDLK